MYNVLCCSKVVEFKHPKELLKCINFDLKDEGDKSEELLEHCKKTIQYSVKTGTHTLLLLIQRGLTIALYNSKFWLFYLE